MTPNHHRLWKLNTGLQATWAMSFSTLPPDSRTLVSKWNKKLALIWKEDFGPLGNSPVLLLLSPGKTLLMTIVAKFLDTSVCGGSWCQSIPCEVHSLWSSPKFLNRFCLTILRRLQSSRLVVQLFLPHFFPSTQLSVNMLGYSTLWTASFFGNVCFWLTLLVKGVNDCLLDNCQISSLPHDCVTQWTKLRDHFEGSRNLCRCFEFSWLACHHFRICWDYLKIITINRTKDLNYFSLCALNLFNTQVSQFELNYWNKFTFPRHSNSLKRTCTIGKFDSSYFRKQLLNLHWHGLKHSVLRGVGEQRCCIRTIEQNGVIFTTIIFILRFRKHYNSFDEVEWHHTCLLYGRPESCYNWCKAYWRTPASGPARSPAASPASAGLSTCNKMQITFSKFFQ